MKGFSLVEMVIFIVIVAIISTSLMKGAESVLAYTPGLNNETQAIEAADRCIDWYVGQRYMKGYDNVSTGTTTPSYCTVPTGFTITTNVALTSMFSETNAFKTVTVTIGGNGNASMSLLLSDY